MIYPRLNHQSARVENLQTVEAWAVLYPISWVFRTRDGHKEPLIRMINKIAEVKDAQVFGLQITQVLVKSLFEEFRITIQKKVFLPFLIWITTNMTYFILITV